ncbi:MAG: phosphate/phosphite/phosphonate ABC transporter substrate-binding protein [Candidatus Riflebacteria bacterium]|nr:phosphate/phosphite/phosphonate ABC transporter substrate-binding protein [Candidatus Riflebacteria bacterium]
MRSKFWIILALLIFLTLGIFFLARTTSEKTKLIWEFSDELPLYFGVVPYQSEEIIKAELTPLMDYLTFHLKRPVKIIISQDYNSLTHLFRTEKIHLGWFGGSYLGGASATDFDILCGTKRNGEDRYHGAIITRIDSGINSIFDLKGKCFAYIDKNSASGYVYPNKLFKNMGIVPKQFFGSIAFAGNQKAAITGVLKGEFDGASIFIEKASWSLADIASESKFQGIKALEFTDWITNGPIAVKKKMPTELRKKLFTLLTEIDKMEKGPETLEKIMKKSFSGLSGFSNMGVSIASPAEKISINSQ